ncbi:gephyrin-like molybdotransferase Glp [Fodinicola acaciae]|uniref:molybdopterin molybdotransferase MoeA n=1 Tax=Fodinicola acaciae TaxID=2681555 RepID=UPI001C9E7BC0|nr:gephyrin-like molybdotransferase Glp [Fodinicola acaciae]
MITPEEAAAIVRQHVRVLPAERLPLVELAGRVLAERVEGTEDLPPFSASTMDGYAVRSADSGDRRLVGDRFAGRMDELTVGPGTAAYITTGAPIPDGADAVVKVELTSESDGVVRIEEEPPAGHNIRAPGYDLRKGELVADVGTILNPASIGLLASAGRVDALVGRRPRVSVLSTGDELVEPGRTPGPGQIRDSNRYALLAALAGLNVDVRFAGLAPDEEDAQRAFLTERIADSDVLISSGGVSMGRKDLMKRLLPELATVHFQQVSMRPGKPVTFATVEGGPLIFALPGNPVSSLIGFELFVRPALLSLQGAGWPERHRVRVRLTHATKPTPRTDYVRAVVTRDREALVATATGEQGSSRLASLAAANALLVLPPEGAPYKTGSIVDALLL